MFGPYAGMVVAASAAFVFGMVLALLGSLKLALAKRLDLGEGRIGFLLSALNLALMVMMLATGLLVDGSVGPRWVILIGSVLTAAAILVLGLRPSYAVTVVAVLLAGLGSAGLSTGSIVLMRTAFFHDSPTASLNLGFVFFALGALVTPVLVDVLSSGLGSFNRTAVVLAVLCLVPAVAALAGGELPPAAHSTGTIRLATAQPVWLAALVFFFYAPLEAAVSIWATTLLIELGQGERRATWVLSGFWCTFLGSRLLTAFAAHLPYHESWERWLLVIAAILTAVLLGNLAGTASRGGARNGLFALGFLLGPILPTLIGILFENSDLEQTKVYGTAYGVVFATGSLGSLVLAPVMGAMAKRRNVQFALRVPMLLAILMALAALVFSLVV